MRVAIVGASGRMGLTLIQAVTQSSALTLTVAIDRADSPVMGKDAGDIAGVGTIDVKVTDKLTEVSDQFDVLIDFTRPDVSMDYLEHCRLAGKKMVIGTTGFNDAQKDQITEASKTTAIMMAPNMSVGVNLTLKLLEWPPRLWASTLTSKLLKPIIAIKLMHHQERL